MLFLCKLNTVAGSSFCAMELPTGLIAIPTGVTATNIWKLSQFLTNDDTQVVWYEAGVGSDSSSTAAKARRTQALLATVGASSGVKIGGRRQHVD